MGDSKEEREKDRKKLQSRIRDEYTMAAHSEPSEGWKSEKKLIGCEVY